MRAGIVEGGPTLRYDEREAGEADGSAGKKKGVFLFIGSQTRQGAHACGAVRRRRQDAGNDVGWTRRKRKTIFYGDAVIFFFFFFFIRRGVGGEGEGKEEQGGAVTCDCLGGR